ncbi:omega-amidase, chloroplastic-like isoform X2 [Asparagus officinalis]|uniref:omega-amidase, chloroplastic-like isoform X2 n=1 Tax=Asparagus officinalis TaxID=4686 RepID=UPI00098E6C5D|nr:omega-amidase, chloroplastic-like isoform X2 [Asparagus officinalis]
MVTEEIERNITHAREVIEEAARKGAELVVLSLHLFDIDIPGKITFNESKTLTHGQHPIIVDTDVGRIGIGICHDISFPELAMLYGAKGAHLICCPGPWYIWHDNWSFALGVISKSKLFVATCSPAQDTSASYITWGHSTLVAPVHIMKFGEVIVTTEHEEAIVIGEIDYSLIELQRSNLPLEKRRRGDLYQPVDVQRMGSQ